MENQPDITNQTYVTYTNFVTERLTASQPEKKTVPTNNTNGPNGANANTQVSAPNYFQIPIMYNYGTDTSRLNDFLLEGPEIESSTGIQSKPSQSNNARMEHSIPCRFDIGDPEQNRFIDVMNAVHRACSHILGTMKGTVKMIHFNPNAPDALFRNPIYRPYDESTGEILQGRSPSMFLKLFSRGKVGMEEQTLFTGVDGNPIPWALLNGVEMKFIPLIHIKRIYVGSKASLQMEVQSAIVTSIRARNSSSKQLATLQRLQQERPQLIDNVSAQVAKLSMDRKDQLPQTAQPNNQLAQVNNQPAQANNQSSNEPNNQPTFAGLNRAPSATPYPTSIPAVPLVHPVPSIDGFTTSAPLRNNVIPTVVVPPLAEGSPKAVPGLLTFN